MKRILLMIFALVCYVMANAEITNTIWGLTLGKSTQQDVEDVIKARDLTVEERLKTEIICTSPVAFSFGGELWNLVDFGFVNGKLSAVMFLCEPEYLTVSTQQVFEELEVSLNRKYSDYIMNGDFNDDVKFERRYTDYVSCINLIYDLDSGCVILGYSDNKLLQMKKKQDASEL